ncbi:MAG: DUF1592 domain-containing protein [Myxococcaceae bacterium]|nr:DUF1592 domain-containing protein [Myxococcaceae bacterium]
MSRALTLIALVALAGCTEAPPAKKPAPAQNAGGTGAQNTAGGHAGGSTTAGPDPVTTIRVTGGAPGVILLTPREYDAALRVVVQDTTAPSRQLPNAVDPDTNHPFDNLWDVTVVSAPKVQTYEMLAAEVTTRLLADTARLQRVLACIPSSTTDRACFANIVRRLGLHALKRPLTSTEQTAFTDAFATFATQGNDWKKGLEVVARTLLQHPDFLFRFEVGTPLDARKTLFELNPFELAAKLSFTLWGEPPSLALLDQAANGDLASADARARIIDAMLADPRAAEHVATFHAQWLGYSKLAHATEPLEKSLNAEARAMVKRVVFEEDREWRDLIELDEAFTDAALSAHYGLAAPATATGWVKQTDTRRIGLFGTGAFMAANAGFGDTSVTKRGYNIRKNLFCELVPPPPVDIDISMPLVDTSGGSRCKPQIRAATVLREGTQCQGCHQKMDYIGFGLEQYSPTGKFRTAQPGAAECPIDGEGEVVGHGKFNGPTAMARLAMERGRLDRCLVQRWLQFSNRNKNDANLDTLTGAALLSFREDGKLKGFIRRFALSDSFRHRSTLEQ